MMTDERIKELSAMCEAKDRFLIGDGGSEMQILNGYFCDAGFADRAVAAGAAMGVRIEKRPSALTACLVEAMQELTRLRATALDSLKSDLWSEVAIAASQRWVLPGQPVIVADAVVAAWEERFRGKSAVKVAAVTGPEKVLDPVDAILERFK